MDLGAVENREAAPPGKARRGPGQPAQQSPRSKETPRISLLE